MDVIKNFKARKGESLYVQARLIIDTLNAFLASTDDLPTLEHAPTKRMDRDKREHEVADEMRQVGDRTQFTKIFMSLWLKSWENYHSCNYVPDDPIRLQIRTYHDSWAVVTSAKLWPDQIIIF